MNAQDLMNSILHLAIQGKLLEQRELEGTAKQLLERIETEKENLIKVGKIKKQKPLPDINADEIPFDIPETWEWIRLAEIGEIVGGGTPKTGNSEYWIGGDIPWMTPADMKFNPGKYVKNGERFITKKGLKESSAKLMPKGTVIYSSRAPIGYIAITENDLATNQGFRSIVPYEISMNEYIYYCLISRTNEIISRASGTTFKEISGSEFGLTIVPLPPLEEQKRIVAKIEELMPHVDKYDVSYSEVEELNKKFPEDMQKSIMQFAIQGKLVDQRAEEGTGEELYKHIQEEKKKLINQSKIKRTVVLPKITEDELPFDIPENWMWVRLGDVFEIINGDRGKNYPSKDKLSNNGIPFISALNIENNTISEEKLMYMNQEQYEKLGSGKLLKGDLVLCIRGSLGKNGRYPFEKGAIASSLAIIRSYVEYDDFYLYITKYLNTGLFYNELMKYNNGTAQPNLGARDLAKFLIPLPPLEEQKRIVLKIDETLLLRNQLVK